MALGGMTAASQSSRTLALSMTLLAQNVLDGHGGIGEGCAMQLTQNGRRILWLAHESAPKNFTGVDVTDPRNPKEIPNPYQPREAA